MFVMLLMVVIMMVFAVLMKVVYYKNIIECDTMSSYECGFDSMEMSRKTFSYRFFLVSVLFLIFDVEVVLLLPFPYLVGVYHKITLFIVVIVILLLGLLYEMARGVLKWL